MWRRKPPTETPRNPGPNRDSVDALLRRLQWTILRPLATRLGGDEASLLHGPGMELSELREYQPGDDVRHIDWNVSARTDRPFVRESQAERALDVWLVIDVSPSVDWGTAETLKRDRAIEFAAVAGQLMMRHGHRVGAILFAERPLACVPPGNGRVHLQRVLTALRDEPRRGERGPTDLAAALTQVAALIRRRSLILLVSDFLVAPGWQPPLRQLDARHELVAVHLRDPREGELPDVGWLTLEDPETGQQLLVDTGDRKLRDRFGATAREQAERIRTDCVACGADYLPLGTDAALLGTMIRFLQARRWRRRGVRRGGMRAPQGLSTAPEEYSAARRSQPYEL